MEKHIDFEDVFQISAKVEFESSDIVFDGLNKISFDVKKKKADVIEIKQVCTKKKDESGKSTGLF